MAVFGTLPAVRAQLAGGERFAPALACVAECLRPGSGPHGILAGLAAGATKRLELAGGAFALLQAYLTRPASECRWETHRAYVDVQAIAAGEELMEAADAARLRVAEDLTPARDAIFYHPFAEGSVLRMDAGAVAVYFPTDGHRGAIAAGTPALVRKVVVKVPVAPAAKA
jgi:biofilm protein TabA